MDALHKEPPTDAAPAPAKPRPFETPRTGHVAAHPENGNGNGHHAATATKAVTANQSRVCQTSAAAFESCLRLLIEATIAVKISGGTSACSSCTKIEPVVASVVVSQLG